MENSNLLDSKISRSLALTPRDSAYTHMKKKIHLEFNGVLVQICQYRANCQVFEKF